MNEFVCNLCYPNAIELGEVVPGLFLMKMNEQYHLLGGQGHIDHIEATFAIRPRPEPPEDEDDDDAAWNKWYGEALLTEEILPKVSWRDGYLFVLQCMEGGYKPNEDGNLLLWLYNKAGQLLVSGQESIKRSG